MKRILAPVLAAGAILLALSSVASAHPYAPNAQRRALRQEMRIRDGVRCGQLTRAEVRRLRAAQRHTLRTHRRMIADGRLSMRERARLHRMLDRQGYRIHRFRHNGRSV
jgi:hypothetical protein